MRFVAPFVSCLFMITLCVPTQADDLSEKYPATLVPTERPVGYDWTCNEDDIWRLKSFSFKSGQELEIEIGPADVVFGHHKSNVLWAVVVPDDPGLIVKASDGQDEKVTSIWLRFHPSRVDELFPSETVSQHVGDAKSNVSFSQAVAKHKLRSSFQASGRPMVPTLHHLVVDCETSSNNRRFYLVDAKQSSVEYVDAFRTRAMPVVKVLSEGGGVGVFNSVWNAFDREYAMFAVKPNVDWNQLRDRYRPLAQQSKNSRELAGVIAKLLAHLEDLHVFVQLDGEFLDGYTRNRPLNASLPALRHLLGDMHEAGRELDWAITNDQIGYISVDGLTDQRLPNLFAETLQKMNGTRGLVLDLRFNGGGGEPLGKSIAGCFLDKRRVYAMHQYRAGPKHHELTKKVQRTVDPNPRWHYVGPVAVLQGQKTMSSAEALTLMLAQCPNVTTLGDRTAGSSGNPRRLEVGAGIVVNLPRWIPMTAEGMSFDTVGVRPDVMVETKPSQFTATEDPVLAAALKHLRSLEPPKTPSLKSRVSIVNEPALSVSDEVKDLWQRVIEVNRVWINPQPTSLSYTLTGGGHVEGENLDIVHRVWVSGESARFETKYAAAIQQANADFDISLLLKGDIQQFVRPSPANLMNGPEPARQWRALKQGITWRTAMHELFQQGLPANCHLAERRREGEKEIVVLQMDLKDGISRVGLGLLGTQLGAVGKKLGHIRLHIQLPEHVPVLEELINNDEPRHNATIQYGRSFHRIGSHRAPQRITHRSLIQFDPRKPAIQWDLLATFQIVDRNWLLKNARNIQDGQPVKSLQVTDVSTKPIPKRLFQLPAKQPAK